MIFGIGTDIVRVARMQDNIERFGDKFAERILTPNEIQEYQQSTRKAHFLAKRFAAKEATAKAMGTGFSQGLSFIHIGVGHDATGKPQLEFSGQATDFMQRNGIRYAHLSLSDEQDHAVAFVTLSTD